MPGDKKFKTNIQPSKTKDTKEEKNIKEAWKMDYVGEEIDKNIKHIMARKTQLEIHSEMYHNMGDEKIVKKEFDKILPEGEIGSRLLAINEEIKNLKERIELMFGMGGVSL